MRVSIIALLRYLTLEQLSNYLGERTSSRLMAIFEIFGKKVLMVFLQLANFLRKEHPTDLRLILDNGHMTKMIEATKRDFDNILYTFPSLAILPLTLQHTVISGTVRDRSHLQRSSGSRQAFA
jgi:hypothetical protein